MDLTPLTDAPTAIQGHAYGALAALVLGLVMVVRSKGTPSHKFLGRVWVAIMAAVALSSFWIQELRLIGAFSPIHLLSILTLVALPYAIIQVRRGNVGAHRTTMIWVFIGGPIIAGLFTLMPGRLMHPTLFGH
jgi:uncharacterized membrane protein